MADKSKWNSIVGMTCPKCRKGHLFAQPFSVSNAYKMHERCPICHQNFEPEPGYYYGAMFISYILTGWLFIIIGLTLVFWLSWSATATILTVAIFAILSHNLFFRFSRSLWIHVFIKYDPSKTDVTNSSLT